jgi:hypothetical protein
MPASGGPLMTKCGPSIDPGLVRITTLTRLELGYSARTAADWRAELGVPPLAAMPVQYLTPAIEDIAAEPTPVPAEGDAAALTPVRERRYSRTARLGSCASRSRRSSS